MDDELEAMYGQVLATIGAVGVVGDAQGARAERERAQRDDAYLERFWHQGRTPEQIFARSAIDDRVKDAREQRRSQAREPEAIDEFFPPQPGAEAAAASERAAAADAAGWDALARARATQAALGSASLAARYR